MKHTVLGVVAVALTASMLVPAAGATHADGLDFVLTGKTHAEFGGSGVPDQGILTQVTDAHPDQSLLEEVSLESECRIWVAEQAAQVDLSYASQTVAYDIDVVGEEAPQSIEVTVGTYNTSEGFTGFGSDTVTGSSLLGTVSGEITTEAFTIEDGEYSATQICVSAVNPGLMAVDTAGGDSQTTYTQEDGTYPTPELGSLLLSGVGTLALFGLARFRREN